MRAYISATDLGNESVVCLGLQPGFNLLQPILQLSFLSVIERERVDPCFDLTLLELACQMSGKPITWRARGLSKSFKSRVILGVTPFRVITYLLSPVPLQVEPSCGGWSNAAGSCLVRLAGGALGLKAK